MEDWNKIEDGHPRTGLKVLCAVISSYGNRFSVLAEYYPAYHTEYEGEDEDFPDYNELDGKYYIPEGWYEWSYEGDVHLALTPAVTHWRIPPLLPIPDPNIP